MTDNPHPTPPSVEETEPWRCEHVAARGIAVQLRELLLDFEDVLDEHAERIRTFEEAMRVAAHDGAGAEAERHAAREAHRRFRARRDRFVEEVAALLMAARPQPPRTPRPERHLSAPSRTSGVLQLQRFR